MNPADFIKDFLLVCLVFVPLERLLSLRSEQRVFRHGWKTDLIHAFANRLLVGLCTLFLIVLATRFSQNAIPASFRAAVAAQPFWLAFIEVLVLADVGFYLIHRAFHRIPWLWRFHAIHHSIEEMDFLAAHRVHPIDQILTRSVTLLPIFALDFAPGPIMLFAILYKWHSLFLHSNVRIGFGHLRWIVASPGFHHWHHANHPEAVDMNFAGQLSVIDLLFGTLHFPQGKMPRKYGIHDPVPGSYIGQLVYPFQHTKGAAANAIHCEQPIPQYDLQRNARP